MIESLKQDKKHIVLSTIHCYNPRGLAKWRRFETLKCALLKILSLNYLGVSLWASHLLVDGRLPSLKENLKENSLLQDIRQWKKKINMKNLCPWFYYKIWIACIPI